MITIEILKDFEKNDIYKLFSLYRKFYGQSNDTKAEKEYLDSLKENDESIVLSALYDGKPVGFAQVFHSYSSVKMKEFWIINDLYVLEAARNSGVASELIKYIEVMAQEKKIEILKISTQKNNDEANSLYNSLGFIINESFNNYGK